MTAPSDARLPDGGGYPIDGLYDLNNNKVGQNQTITTSSSEYGEQVERWSGVDVSAQARLSGGVMLQGGVSTGKTTTDNCDVGPKLDNPSTRFCHNETPYLPQYKFGGSYTLPWEIELSGTFQSFVGPAIQANATFTNAQVQRIAGPPAVAGHDRDHSAARAEHDVQRPRHASWIFASRRFCGSAPTG